MHMNNYINLNIYKAAPTFIESKLYKDVYLSQKQGFITKIKSTDSKVQFQNNKIKSVDEDTFGVFRLEYDISKEDPSFTKQWKQTLRVAVSGASGQIANHLLFMIASGEAFGYDQPLSLQLLGSDKSREALEGVAMELEDSLYPLLREVRIGTDPYKIFRDVDWAILVGARPRGPGMERSELLNLNGEIFQQQGMALNEVADRNVKVLVVGNPCCTNTLICLKNAPDLNKRNFHALTRLDENRAKCQLALKLGKFYNSISRVAVWGNHSTSMVPDYLNALVNGKPLTREIQDIEYLQKDFVMSVAQRGAQLIKKWGRSSAASTAVAATDAIRSLVNPTLPYDCFTSGVYSEGNPYGINSDLVFSFPCFSKEGNGSYKILDDFVIDSWLRKKIKESEFELLKEKECIAHLVGMTSEQCQIQLDTSLPGES